MSEAHRDRLVEEIIQSQPELRAFVQHHSVDMTAGSWDMLSYSFQCGFEGLWDIARAGRSGPLLRPLLVLWRHSVELSLKAALVEVSGELPRGLGHDLSKLFSQLLAVRAKRGCVDDDDYTRGVLGMISLVQSLDPFSDRFRYPAGRKGEPYGGISVDLDKLFQAHWSIVTWCEGSTIELREAEN
ncbi:hypothetical protein D3C71_181910 [compost metagenome]